MHEIFSVWSKTKQTDWAVDANGINLIFCGKIGEVQGLVF